MKFSCLKTKMFENSIYIFSLPWSVIADVLNLFASKFKISKQTQILWICCKLRYSESVKVSLIRFRCRPYVLSPDLSHDVPFPTKVFVAQGEEVVDHKGLCRKEFDEKLLNLIKANFNPSNNRWPHSSLWQHRSRHNSHWQRKIGGRARRQRHTLQNIFLHEEKYMKVKILTEAQWRESWQSTAVQLGLCRIEGTAQSSQVNSAQT